MPTDVNVDDAETDRPRLRRFCAKALFSRSFRPLAAPTGFEPVTYRLGGGRSILLSYGAARQVRS